jgi:hypothetical protein
MRNPGKLQSVFAHHRLLPMLRLRRARAPKQDTEWVKEVAAMERVCQEIAETLQNTIRTLDESIRETDAALAEIAKEKKLTQTLLREMGVGQ